MTEHLVYVVFVLQVEPQAEYCKCFAKEHSFPSSWFDDSTLMRTDMHFVWPADSKFNNENSNFPLGYVRTASFILLIMALKLDVLMLQEIMDILRGSNQ
jgi:endonuclease I